jgi:WD40 repeat protein
MREHLATISGIAFWLMCMPVAPAQSAPGLVLQVGHNGGIGSLTTSHDCTLLASSGSLDQSVRIYDLAAKKMISILDEGQLEANAVVFMKEPAQLLAVNNKNVNLVDTFSGQILSAFYPPALGPGGALQSAAVSPDETLVAAGSNLGDVFVWDRASGELRHSFNMGERKNGETGTDILSFVQFTPDGKQLVATGGVGGRIAVFDLSGTPDRVWSSKHISVETASLSPDGTILALAGFSAAGTNAPSATVWDIKSGNQLANLIDDDVSASAIGFAGDTADIIVAAGNKITLFNGKTFRRKNQYDLHYQLDKLSTSCGILFSIWGNGIIYAFDPENPLDFDPSKLLKDQLPTIGASQSVQVPSMLMEDNKGRIVLGSSNGSIAHVFTFNPETATIENLHTFGSNIEIEKIEATTDVKLFLLSNYEKAEINDLSTNKSKALAYPGNIGTAYLFPDGRNVLMSAYEANSHIASVKSKSTIKFPVDSIEAVAFHPSTNIAAIVARKKNSNLVLSIWDMKDKTKIAETTATGNDISFSPDGKKLWTFDDVIKSYDMETGSTKEPFDRVSSISTGTISKDGKTIAAASGNKRLFAWDLQTNKILWKLPFSGQSVYHMTFANQDEWIVTVHGDGGIRIWSSRDGRLLTGNPPIFNGVHS